MTIMTTAIESVSLLQTVFDEQPSATRTATMQVVTRIGHLAQTFSDLFAESLLIAIDT